MRHSGLNVNEVTVAQGLKEEGMYKTPPFGGVLVSDFMLALLVLSMAEESADGGFLFDGVALKLYYPSVPSPPEDL